MALFTFVLSGDERLRVCRRAAVRPGDNRVCRRRGEQTPLFARLSRHTHN